MPTRKGLVEAAAFACCALGLLASAGFVFLYSTRGFFLVSREVFLRESVVLGLMALSSISIATALRRFVFGGPDALITPLIAIGFGLSSFVLTALMYLNVAGQIECRALDIPGCFLGRR